VIPVLMFMPLIGCGYWLVRRAIPRVSTPVAEPEHRAARAAAVLGIEDDPGQWRVARGAWTALDERQLVRLLTDSAP
jgi:hypothetical protein